MIAYRMERIWAVLGEWRSGDLYYHNALAMLKDLDVSEQTAVLWLAGGGF